MEAMSSKFSQCASSALIALRYEECILPVLPPGKGTFFSAANLFNFMGLGEVTARALKNNVQLCASCGSVQSGGASNELLQKLTQFKHPSRAVLLASVDLNFFSGQAGRLRVEQLVDVLGVERFVFEQQVLKREDFARAQQSLMQTRLDELSLSSGVLRLVLMNFTQAALLQQNSLLEVLEQNCADLGIKVLEILAATDKGSVQRVEQIALGEVCAKCGGGLTALKREILSSGDKPFGCTRCNAVGLRLDCEECHGMGLSPQLLEIPCAELTLRELGTSPVERLLEKKPYGATPADSDYVESVLRALERSAVGYLTLAHPLCLLSSGERVRLKLALLTVLEPNGFDIEVEHVLDVFDADEAAQLRRACLDPLHSANTLRILERGRVRLARVRSVSGDRPKEVSDPKEHSILVNPAELLGGNFSGDQLVLRAGAQVCISGSSGSGKSMLCAALKSFLDQIGLTQNYFYDYNALDFGASLRLGDYCALWDQLRPVLLGLPQLRALGIAPAKDFQKFLCTLPQEVRFGDVMLRQLPFLSLREICAAFEPLGVLSPLQVCVNAFQLQALTPAQRIHTLPMPQRSAVLLAQALIKCLRQRRSKPAVMFLDNCVALLNSEQFAALPGVAQRIGITESVLIYVHADGAMGPGCDLHWECRRVERYKPCFEVRLAVSR